MDKTQRDIKLFLKYDGVTQLFSFIYSQEEHTIFEVKVNFQEFEKLAIDMISIVKKFNLDQAIKYADDQKLIENVDFEHPVKE